MHRQRIQQFVREHDTGYRRRERLADDNVMRRSRGEGLLLLGARPGPAIHQLVVRASPTLRHLITQPIENIPRQDTAARTHLYDVKVLWLAKFLPDLRQMTGYVRAKHRVKLRRSIVVVGRAGVGLPP